MSPSLRRLGVGLVCLGLALAGARARDAFSGVEAPVLADDQGHLASLLRPGHPQRIEPDLLAAQKLAAGHRREAAQILARRAFEIARKELGERAEETDFAREAWAWIALQRAHYDRAQQVFRFLRRHWEHIPGVFKLRVVRVRTALGILELERHSPREAGIHFARAREIFEALEESQKTKDPKYLPALEREDLIRLEIEAQAMQGADLAVEKLQRLLGPPEKPDARGLLAELRGRLGAGQLPEGWLEKAKSLPPGPDPKSFTRPDFSWEDTRTLIQVELALEAAPYRRAQFLLAPLQAKLEIQREDFAGLRHRVGILAARTQLAQGLFDQAKASFLREDRRIRKRFGREDPRRRRIQAWLAWTDRLRGRKHPVRVF